jgi:hypothetical protein
VSVVPCLATVTGHSQTVHIDLGLISGKHIGHDAPGASGHGPTQRSMTSAKVQVAVTGFTQDRRAVWRHGAQASPKLGFGHIPAFGEQIIHHEFKRASWTLI